MIRDKESKALVEDDILALNKYRIEKKQIREIDQLKKEMGDVKNLLVRICQSLDVLMEEKL